ncbi:MAG: hypothetical protein H0S80_10680 [Desulfovibrionaceae bacterium]|nr:hypothetical protein [Desulfovibrionaceae bacterium]
MIDFQTKRQVEKTLRSNGFGQGTAKKIVALIGPVLEGKGKEAMKGKGNEDRP